MNKKEKKNPHKVKLSTSCWKHEYSHIFSATLSSMHSTVLLCAMLLHNICFWLGRTVSKAGQWTGKTHTHTQSRYNSISIWWHLYLPPSEKTATGGYLYWNVGGKHTHTSCLQPQDSWLHTFDQMWKHSFVKIPEFSVSVISKTKSKTRKISAGNLRFLLFWNSLCWNAPHKKRSLISSSRRRRRKIPLSHKSKTSNSFGGSPLCANMYWFTVWIKMRRS